VGEDGRILGGEEWQEKVHNREEWKKLLRTARNCCVLHMPMERMNECFGFFLFTVLKLFVKIALLLGTIRDFCSVCIILLGMLISLTLK
jgi:hypothetical protein